MLVFDSRIHIWVMGGLFIVFLSPCQSTVENGAHKKPKEAQAEKLFNRNYRKPTILLASAS